MASDKALTKVVEQLNDLRETVQVLQETHNIDIAALRSEVTALHARLSFVSKGKDDPSEPIGNSRFCCGAVVPSNPEFLTETTIWKEKPVDEITETSDVELNGHETCKAEFLRISTEASNYTMRCQPRSPRPPPPSIPVQPCEEGLPDDAQSLISDKDKLNMVEETLGAPTTSELDLPKEELDPVATKTNDDNDVPRQPNVIVPSSPDISRLVHRAAGVTKTYVNTPHRINHHYVRDACTEEYRFGESVWEVTLFVGDEAFSILSSLFIFTMFICLIVVLVVFNGIVLTDFTEMDTFNQDMKDQLKVWRLQESHLLSFASQVTGTSLVSRVCNQDASLLMSTQQMNIVGTLQDYLPEEDGVTIDHVLSGPVLCLMALFVWYMTIIKELQRVLQLSRAVHHLHSVQHLHVTTKGRHTKITHEGICFHLRSISSRRAVYAIVIIIGRIGMCGMLLISGTLYIIHTVSMEDIILNCAALSIILDVDELMFESVAPAQVRSFIRHLQPVEVPAWPCYKGASIFAIIVFVSVGGFLLCAKFIFLGPFLEDLRESRDILCGGDRDFLVQADAVGLGYVVPGNPFGSSPAINERLFDKAVEKGIHLSSIDKIVKGGWMLWGGVGWEPSIRYTVESNRDSMESKMNENWFHRIRDYQNWQTAEGKSEISSSGRVDATLKFFRGLLGNDTAVCHGLHEVGAGDTAYPHPSCYQLWNDHASTVERIQALCPVGCGCNTPWLGTIYKNRAGCPVNTITSDTYQKQLAHFPCENPSGHLNSTILSWLNEWVKNPEFQQEMSSSQKAKLQPPESPSFCDSVFEVLGRQETMAPVVCPIHFGCKYGNYSPWNWFPVKPYCPTSCHTTTTTTIFQATCAGHSCPPNYTLNSSQANSTVVTDSNCCQVLR